MPKTIPKLITVGVIAERLNVPIHRVHHVLSTRPHIQPAAVAGKTRLYSSVAIAQVRYQLTVIDARRASGSEEVSDVE